MLNGITLNQAQIILICITVSMVFSAIADVVWPQASREIGFGHSLLMTVLIFLWVKAHVRIENIREPRGSAFIAALFAPIGIPVYFVRGFGWQRGMFASLKALAFLVVLFLLYLMVWYVGENVFLQVAKP